MKRREFLKTTALAATAMAAAGTVAWPRRGFAAVKLPLKVGFVYTGPVGDFGYTYQHDQGRKYMDQQLGGKVKSTFVENVPEGSESIRVIRELAATGNQLIFGTSFGYMNPLAQVATQFPSAFFEMCTGYKVAHNMGTYTPKWIEGRYLCGLLAGALTKTNLIGEVAPFPIPEVIRGANAFIIGAREINPKAKMRLIFVSSFYDPGKERLAAETLISQGADIINKHTDSPAPVEVAAKHNLLSFGYDADYLRFGPKSVITSIIDNWGPYYARTAASVINGTWKSEQVWQGLLPHDAGLITMAPLNKGIAIPEKIAALYNERKAAIEAQKFTVFKGPLVNAKGQTSLAAGKTMTKDQILSMDYFLEGVEGQLPKGA